MICSNTIKIRISIMLPISDQEVREVSLFSSHTNLVYYCNHITSTYNFTLFLTTFIGENNLLTHLHKFRFYIQRRRVAIPSYLCLCIVWSFQRGFFAIRQVFSKDLKIISLSYIIKSFFPINIVLS